MKSIRDFRFEFVWGNAENQWKEQLKTFWKAHKVIPDEAALESRVHQALLLVYNREDKIVAVTTAYTVKVPLLNDHWFYQFRYFISPPYRIAGLHAKLIQESAMYLQAKAGDEAESPIGIVALLENKKMEQAELVKRPVWRLIPFVLAGYNTKGQQIRVFYFEGARI